ncbi:hypothetical protein LTR66_011517 [Elasticomyces elasticus]|nr:hypothetical protein LTR66_011517 [Elasticomyces elasticus]
MAPITEDDQSSGVSTPMINGIKTLDIATPASSASEADTFAENKETLEKLDPALVGMSVGLKHFYSGKEDKRGRFQWQTTIPEDVGKPAEDAETSRWALLVRNVKVYNDPRRVLALHSIVVQSPLLKNLLAGVLEGYPGVTTGLQRLEFSGKFEPLIHRWTELAAAIERLKVEAGGQGADNRDEKTLTLQHAELLYGLLASEFKNSIDASQDMKLKGVMTYEHLWTLFQPGSLVFSRQEGQDRIFKLHSSKYGTDRDGNPVFWLTCTYVDFDGTKFGTNKLNMSIPQYSGTRPISSLSTLPLDSRTDREEMRARLIERGARVESFAGSHYKGYNGMGWRRGNFGAKDKYSIKGRVVIDTYGWNRFNPNMAIFVTPLHQKEHAPQRDDDDYRGSHRGNDDEYDASYDDNGCGDDGGMPIDGHFADEDEEAQRQPLTTEQKLLCTHLLRGYSLKEKLWLNLFVNSVQDIAFNTRAFESLVLPANQKELVLGFTATQQAYRSTFDDVIEGKGRGIILLLCGPPGVGKTLTAESVAEEMKVPLYMMSAGDLGLDPRHVESKLQGIMDMCTRWNAILLLDEADVFLEQRSLHELERNKLVSIFLRILEYYEGIMFLTTNRVNTFDAAFQSRIHISLDYPELSKESRRTVWRNFLAQHNVAQASAAEREKTRAASLAEVDGRERQEEALAAKLRATQPHAIEERHLRELSAMDMNGRQIKNVLKTAQLLASRRGERLSHTHVKNVLEVTQHLHNANMEKESTRASIFS